MLSPWLGRSGTSAATPCAATARPLAANPRRLASRPWSSSAVPSRTGLGAGGSKRSTASPSVIAAADLPAPTSATTTSRALIRPRRPVPVSAPSAIPASRASRLALGLAARRPGAPRRSGRGAGADASVAASTLRVSANCACGAGPLPCMRAIGWPICTMSPGAMSCAASTPSGGAGTSTAVLSVSTSSRVWPSVKASPCQSVTRASSIVSPRRGRGISWGRASALTPMPGLARCHPAGRVGHQLRGRDRGSLQRSCDGDRDVLAADPQHRHLQPVEALITYPRGDLIIHRARKRRLRDHHRAASPDHRLEDHGLVERVQAAQVDDLCGHARRRPLCAHRVRSTICTPIWSANM